MSSDGCRCQIKRYLSHHLLDFVSSDMSAAAAAFHLRPNIRSFTFILVVGKSVVGPVDRVNGNEIEFCLSAHMFLFVLLLPFARERTGRRK